MRKNWRRWAWAVAISLAAHGGVFLLFLTLRPAPTYSTASIEVQLLPPLLERRLAPEPEPKSPAPKAAEAKAAPAPTPAPAPVPAGEIPAGAGAPSETGTPSEGRAGARGPASDFVSIPPVHCLDRNLTPAERNECERRRFTRRPGEVENPIGLANDTLERDLDRREARVTATSRCEGWASDREMRNIGLGCSLNTKSEGTGTRRRDRGVLKRF